MFIGFDYGTSNCSVAYMQAGHPQFIPLENGHPYIPSVLTAPTREAISEYLFRLWHIKPLDKVGEHLLRIAISSNKDEGIELSTDDLAFGERALARYLESPQDVYYIKSPKSFLGAMGLRDMQLRFFEDLVCAMMTNIKRQAESEMQQAIEDTVIGRPINFHGRGGEASNRQAEHILKKAATRAGFKQIEFQFEPVAAGLEFEATLTQDQTVLVVDIGGGTTDCSLIQMGPTWRGQTERTQSLLAHTGQRVGGNDLDIYLTFKQFMPEFGLGSTTTSGLDMPIPQFWNPIAINDVAAQGEFYSKSNRTALQMLHQNATSPEKLARLLKLYDETLSHRVVRTAEETKIALSECERHHAVLDLHPEVLEIPVSKTAMQYAIEAPKSKMAKLVEEAVKQGGTMPQTIFMTGGSAKSPILRQAVQSVLPNIPVVSGNDFGSVTAGLARWAEGCFR